VRPRWPCLSLGLPYLIVCRPSAVAKPPMCRYSEYDRPVYDQDDAESLGFLYGNLLRMMASGQGWVQG
jgi:hydroxymethylbilane synthase